MKIIRITLMQNQGIIDLSLDELKSLWTSEIVNGVLVQTLTDEGNALYSRLSSVK